MRLDDARLIFITGTDTGVGKTLLTALLLEHLRKTGCRASALKPFCSGSRADAELLCQLQDGELTLQQINPFYFREPLAPLVAARKHHREITLEDVLSHIHSVVSGALPLVLRSKIKSQKSRIMLIEGAGGLLVPLGEGFTTLDLIIRLDCEVIVVAANKLGTINHTLLTLHALQKRCHASRITLLLSNAYSPELCCRSNPGILAELAAPVPLFCLPFLGSNACAVNVIKRNARRLEHRLFPLVD